MASYTREEREARKNYAKERSIVEVAESLGMELVKSGAEYRWKKHDSMVITPRTNLWHWFSQDKGGDTIELVRTINNISFNQAIDYLNDGDYSEGTLQHNDAPQAFKNYLAPYEQPFVEGRSYLKEVRGLSDETIDFFLDQNVITQANAKIGDVIEPVIVFKTINHKGEMIGGNLQGIVENREHYDRHGYFKGIMRNSNGDNGLSVDIGRPERLIFAESPIDLMSYYELHKDQLENVRLVSMDGLKDGIIGTNLARLESEMRNVYMRDEDWDRDLLKKSVDDGYFNDEKHADVITLAVDNDQGGRNFIQSLEAKGVVVKAELPAEKDGFEKQDWNDVLKDTKTVDDHSETMATIKQVSRSIYQAIMDRGANITLSDDKQEEVQEPALQVLFDFSESREIATLYENGQVIPYQEFVENLYRENDLCAFGGGYDKTYFSLIDEKGQELVEFRYDLGSESETLSEQLSETLAPAYLELAQAIDQEASSQIEGTEKAPDQNQGPVAEESSMGLDNLSVSNEDTQKERTNFSKGSLQPEAEGSTAPVSESSDTFERSVTSRPTLSSHPLHFSITEDFKSNKIDSYHAIRPSELARLNRRADHLQKSAKFYYDELADSKISYFTSNGDIVQVSFAEENFMHLTGIKPIGEGQTPQKTLRDFVSGHGEFQNIYLAPQNNSFKKLDVLQDIEVTLQTDTFYFDDLQDVDRYSGRFDSLLKADDSDLMLIFRDTDNQGLVPVSVFKATDTLRSELKETTKNEIIGIFRERDGQIEKIAINDQLISDDGQEMFEILKNLSADNAHEVTPKSSQLDEPYTSDKMAVKQGISDRVREIIAEGSARKVANESQVERQTNPSVTVETRLDEPQEAPKASQQDQIIVPAEEVEDFSYSTATAEALSNQAIKAIKSYAASPEDLKEYLDFMSHFTKYSPRNTALIHEQWRGANAVATYKHWEALGKRMGIGPDDVLGGTNVEYTNDRTGKTRTIKNEGLSVRAGQKGHIKLFKPMMDEMIPVLDETGQQLKNDKGYPKYKPKKKATAAEEEAIKQGRLEVKSFPKRDLKTGKALYKTFTVFELSQTNLKPEKYPNIIPNRHYDFDTDKVKTQEVLLGLKDYADCLGVSIEKVDMMSNVKGQFNKEDQSIQLNDQNTKGEMVGTLIHELAHATLHNPKFKDCYKEEVPKDIKELEAEMTSYVTAKHFGLDTSEKAIPYMANWTDKLSKLSDDELDWSMKRVHETTKKMLKAVEKHTKPLAQRLSPEQGLSQHQNLNPLPPKM
ncbi:PBECR4 domain-containing protein [Streptococcus vestibularis]|uniref:PBECR4 domain-containing protein n=1 Tax=Streptococcus vestibularis TaxID=1343 RepID=UPI0023308D3B|nr:PBECR4 domain-containing protein [Streptococcus vestibularis]MDB6183552.1 PBECR4 domain-containing protein [Streptococcus vestibularis]MDB6201229.1 PBECR4 domain-containing protein [Streptococcus vestibularis]MDB6206976.1 PBECR4 domain-containing protein [Streptococcus vestibularis]MDB6210774.1 PBECR4 domain-containing protein [Streptococcus vestibularis]MDB6214355.1 PBECR4 domain-containing protein [Streptococcus vestibularis]